MSYQVRKNRRKTKGGKGVPGVGFKLTNDGNFDLEDRKLVNVKDPTENTDATNLSYVKNNCFIKDEDMNLNGKSIYGLTGDIKYAGQAANKKYVDENTVNKKYIDDKALTYNDKYSTISLAKNKKNYRFIDA